jgi:DNA-binding PadR family transcriptional regulator
LRLKASSYLILGMLRSGVDTGYAIKRAVDQSTRFFWAASFAQVYPELASLEQDGYIVGDEQPRGDRPRKTYRLTAKGSQAFRAWLASDRAPSFEFRDEGLLRLFFADGLADEEAVALVRRLRKHAEELNARFREDILPMAREQSTRPPLSLRCGPSRRRLLQMAGSMVGPTRSGTQRPKLTPSAKSAISASNRRWIEVDPQRDEVAVAAEEAHGRCVEAAHLSLAFVSIVVGQDVRCAVVPAATDLHSDTGVGLDVADISGARSVLRDEPEGLGPFSEAIADRGSASLAGLAPGCLEQCVDGRRDTEREEQTSNSVADVFLPGVPDSLVRA